MRIANLVLGPIGTNCYIVGNDKSAIIIDPASGYQKILDELKKFSGAVTHIFYTHGHWDHTGSGVQVKEATSASVLMNRSDLSYLDITRSAFFSWVEDTGSPAQPDAFVKDGQEIVSGDMIIRIIFTPGHTPGSICLLIEDNLFSGDTLFCNSVGRTDFPGGDTGMIMSSIEERIFTLADDVKVFPGHGPATSVGIEKNSNPFFN